MTNPTESKKRKIASADAIDDFDIYIPEDHVDGKIVGEDTSTATIDAPSTKPKRKQREKKRAKKPKVAIEVCVIPLPDFNLNYILNVPKKN
jgi:hypothetical protein